MTYVRSGHDNRPGRLSLLFIHSNYFNFTVADFGNNIKLFLQQTRGCYHAPGECNKVQVAHVDRCQVL